MTPADTNNQAKNKAMARSPAVDPLIPLPMRLPTSTVMRLREQAAAAGVTMSDVLRSHLTLAEAKPLGKPVPRKRPPKLAAVSGVDPLLMRQLASIGSNINQLAHRVNSVSAAGDTLNLISVLTELQQIERHLRDISNH